MNANAQSLNDYKWKNRLIFLVGDTIKSQQLQDQLTLFMNEKEEMAERDVLLFMVNDTDVVSDEKAPSAISAAELRKVAHIDSGFEGVLLLGKDGGYKLKKGFLVEPDTIFDLIDSMPMRQFENKNN